MLTKRIIELNAYLKSLTGILLTTLRNIEEATIPLMYLQAQIRFSSFFQLSFQITSNYDFKAFYGVT